MQMPWLSMPGGGLYTARRSPGELGLSESTSWSCSSGNGSASSPGEQAMSGRIYCADDEYDDAAGSSTAYSSVDKSCGRGGEVLRYG